MNRQTLRRELLRRWAAGFPWGAAGIYLVFLLGNLFTIPAPADGMLRMVSDTLSVRWGSPVAAALVQFLWAGVLGAVLAMAGLPFLAERRTLLWSGLHLLLTAAVFSLAGWRCGWFPYAGTWLLLLGLLLLCYLLMWAVRWIGWRQDLRLLRLSAGLPVDGGDLADSATLDSSHKKDGVDLEGSTVLGSSHKKDGTDLEGSTMPDGSHKKDGAVLEDSPTAGRKLVSYLLLAAATELLLPWLLRAVDAPDVPVLTGLFYPFLILPLFAFLSAHAVGKRCSWPWVLLYAASCGLLTVPNVFLLYNYTALFQSWTAGVAALLGGLLGCLRRKIKS